MADRRVLCWLHVGDLHLTAAGEQNHKDLQRIARLAGGLPGGAIDFVLLPGDIADDGTAAQFELARDALAALPQPVHAIPGDHDAAAGDLSAFHRVLGARPLPHAESIGGHLCLFLDIVSAGSGGLDFRLDAAQLEWCRARVESAAASGQAVAVFMRSYPADLRTGRPALQSLLRDARVACVDMGHTHYNELANDGRTVFMATRSTGQVEEGPPGISIAAIDGGGVSWRFKALDQAWPFVLVTHPTDRRLAAEGSPAAAGRTVVRAKILSDAAIETVEASVDGGRRWAPMRSAAGATSLWEATLEGDVASVTVRARDRAGRSDADTVEPWRPGMRAPARAADGSDKDAVGAWPERGILGSQLGPNRNGRAW